jgi:hypothetical protein
VVDKVWAIELPEPLDAPVTPDCTTVHEKDVPPTALVNVNAVV